MKKIYFKNLRNYLGKEIIVQGVVKNLRKTKSIWFLILSDSTGDLQVTISNSQDFLKFDLLVGSCVSIEGILVENTSVHLNGMELLPKKVVLLSSSDLYPIDALSSSSLKQDYRFLVLRESKNREIFRVQTMLENFMRAYWVSNDFIEIHSPKLLGAPSESGAELFELDYFGQKAYLAQSPQFYKQMAMSAGFDKVFEIGPVFRANPSFTSRHDTEFTSVDVEMSWIDSHFDIMDLEEDWLCFVLQGIEAECSLEKEFGITFKAPKSPFPRIAFSEAINILSDVGHTIPEGEDIDPQGEKLLYNYVKEKYGHEFVFIYDYPVSVRPFYHMRHSTDTSITKSYDLLWKGIEITTGAQREHRYALLKQQSEEKGLSQVDFYLNFFKYGCPPHGGFGLGLTRMLMILLGFNNVREVTFLYRGPKRLTP